MVTGRKGPHGGPTDVGQALSAFALPIFSTSWLMMALSRRDERGGRREERKVLGARVNRYM